KLVYASENLDYKQGQHAGTHNTIKYIKEAKDNFPDQYVLPFPLHTKFIDFDGIYGEATIDAGIIIGVWPIMYVSRPDATADDGIVKGPIDTTWHDLDNHFLRFKNNPVWFLKMPNFILNYLTIDNDVVLYLFKKTHEDGLNFSDLTVDRTDFIPFYIEMINFVLVAISHHIPQFKNLKTINENQLNGILQETATQQHKDINQITLYDVLDNLIYKKDDSLSNLIGPEIRFMDRLIEGTGLGSAIHDQMRSINDGDLLFSDIKINRVDLFPFYIDRINSVLTAISHHIPQFKNLKKINENQLNGILQETATQQHKDKNQITVYDVLNNLIFGNGQTIDHNSKNLTRSEKFFIDLLLVGRHLQDALSSSEIQPVK
ncbi:MAG: hypothetical protein KF820_03485, partial [Candidatus Paracaedibacteraceae bacterium]|nr:hypothetical protein [Candidatus Paracaedibacteraceae bacterium]